MSSSESAPTSTSAASLRRFPCDHCRVELTVPRSVAGVSGPCPRCGGSITAPSDVQELAAPELLAHFSGGVSSPPLVLPVRRDRPKAGFVVLKGALGAFAGVVLIGGLWVVAAQFFYLPGPNLELVQGWFRELFGPIEVSRAKTLVIQSQAWNVALEVPADDWVLLHPGANNRICTLVNEKNAKCRVVFHANALGSIAQDQDWFGGTLRQELKSGLSLQKRSKGKEMETGEEKEIGGRKFVYSREEVAESSDLFRPAAVTICTYDLMDNNIVYSYEFVGCGAEAFGALPEIAESVLCTIRPLVKDAGIASTNNLTYSDPRLLCAETGLDFPCPGTGWAIIPDFPTPLALLGTVTSQRVLGTAFGRSGDRIITSGMVGSPCVGYATEDGDLAGMAAVQLPAELLTDLPHLADLILEAWFPEVSINRENERPYQAGTVTGTEYDGQISSNLNPSPFVFRMVRRGLTVTALGACSFSQNRSKAELSALLDQAMWGAPTWGGAKLSSAYTPEACHQLWEFLILKIGEERRNANQLAEALDIYQRSYKVRSAGKILLAICETLSLLSRNDQAVELMEKEWRQQDPKNDFLIGAAQFMAQHQHLETATTLFTMALGRAKDGQEVLKSDSIESYLLKLRDEQAHDEALRVLDLLNYAMPSNHWHLWEAYILSNGPKTKARGQEIMEGLVASMKKNHNLVHEFLHFLKEHQCHELGLRAAMGVLRLDPREGVAWLVRASCELEMGETVKAAATLAQARLYNPRLSDLDEIVYAMSGDEGGPVLSKDGPQTTPISLPPELRQLLQHEPLVSVPNSEAPYQYLFRIRSLTCDPGEPFRSTNRYSIRIQNSAGMEAFNILKITFRPRAERLQINELRVRTPDGKVISPTNMSEAFVSEDNADGMHTGMKILNVPVPGLTPGCVLDYTVTEESLGLLAGSINSCFHFAAEAPCALDVLYLNTPNSKLDFRHSTGRAPSKIPTGVVWVERQLPAVTRERFQPSLEKMVPVLWTGDSSESWTRLGSDYFMAIQDKLRPDEATTKLAKEKTKSCKTDSERIEALSEYVRNVLSYAAIEFGMRAFVPNTASESVKNRFGDCKDHSALLYQLLKAVGIPARLVLANASTAVQPDLPSLGAFNHMITAVPGTDKGAWDFIDCTNKCMAPQPGVPPWMLAGKYALVLGENPSKFSPDSSSLVKIKDFPEDFEKVTVERTAQIIEGRHLNIREWVTITGTTACGLRQLLNTRVDRHDTTMALKSILGLDRNRCVVRLAQADNLVAVEKPLVLQLEYELRNACTANGSGLTVHLPNLAEMLFLDPDTASEIRLSPFQFQTPLHLKSRNRLYGHSGARLAPLEITSEDEKFVSWKTAQTNSEGYAEVAMDLTRKAGTFPAADYPALQTQLNAALQCIEEVNFIPGVAPHDPVTKQ